MLEKATRARRGCGPIGLAAALTLTVMLVGGCARPDLLTDANAVNADLSIHVVVENPAGTTEKWEVRANGRLVQEHRDGVPIEIPYLAWPANSGMIPRTLHAEDIGGDGEPLDALVLGASISRGRTVRVRPIGLLRVVDRLERDDKILAVPMSGTFSEIRDVDALERAYPGVREILAGWYARSRPGGAIEVQGFASRAAATLLIEDGVVAFENALESGSVPDWETP